MWMHRMIQLLRYINQALLGFTQFPLCALLTAAGSCYHQTQHALPAQHQTATGSHFKTIVNCKQIIYKLSGHLGGSIADCLSLHMYDHLWDVSVLIKAFFILYCDDAVIFLFEGECIDGPWVKVQIQSECVLNIKSKTNRVQKETKT